MPMIPIEQDSPEVIEVARQAIAEMVQEVIRHADDAMLWHGAVMMVTGHLGALLAHGLISVPMFEQLIQERDAARKAAQAE
ncbi:hypothetical protein FGA82_17925 [Pseudomonas fluorescens]|uniref:hypothetical protein n=1 Tax=Pseudomonas fluorescens TaxID=294 RepID=UPI001131C29F|nr:hypothetical protein [Pseudomonas fluorescens]TMU77501.1 hypothetical protein FGA82_17925 [Pseudomonas fluorescens]